MIWIPHFFEEKGEKQTAQTSANDHDLCRKIIIDAVGDVPGHGRFFWSRGE